MKLCITYSVVEITQMIIFDTKEKTYVEGELIPRFPDYLITKSGNVYSNRCKKWRKLKPSSNIDGYKVVYVRNDSEEKKFFVHHLVLITFVEERRIGMECRHLDGTRDNNKLENLKWGTKSENERDKILHGTNNRGQEPSLSKDEISQIFALREIPLSMKEISQRMGISKALVSITLNKRNPMGIKSSSLKMNDVNYQSLGTKLSIEDIKDMLELSRLGESIDVIALKFQISNLYAKKILNGTGRIKAHQILGDQAPIIRRKIKKTKISEDLILKVFELRSHNFNKKEIAKIVGIARRTVIRIIQRKIWEHVSIPIEILNKVLKLEKKQLDSMTKTG